MEDLDGLFHNILRPALGCTEPASVALAVASAVQAAGGWTPEVEVLPILPGSAAEIVRIEVRVSRNIFKNTFSIAIPNANGHKGILMSAALGAFCDPRRELELFSLLNREIIQMAECVKDTQKVSVEVVKEVKAELYIEAVVSLKNQQGLIQGRSVIRHDHSHIVALHQGSRLIYGSNSGDGLCPGGDDAGEGLKKKTIAELVEMVDDLPPSVCDLVRQTIQMNIAACETGLAQPLGLGTGYYAAGGSEFQNTHPFHVATNMAAAGSDTRMSGYPVSVMSSAGSGNQGIIATIPVVVYARHLGVDEACLLRAVAFSHLITMYLTQYVGYLSALCGVSIKAGIGAACGVVYAMGGGADDISQAIKVMAATLTGMICDGAKAGCALKVGTAADMAIRAAILAMKKMQVPDDNGIVAQTAEETIQNLAKLSRSMDAVDEEILEIMMEKIKSH
jgi:L-cysteine desulfidase